MKHTLAAGYVMLFMLHIVCVQHDSVHSILACWSEQPHFQYTTTANGTQEKIGTRLIYQNENVAMF